MPRYDEHDPAIEGCVVWAEWTWLLGRCETELQYWTLCPSTICLGCGKWKVFRLFSCWSMSSMSRHLREVCLWRRHCRLSSLSWRRALSSPTMNRANVVAAFPIFLSICVQDEGAADRRPRYVNWFTTSRDIRLFQADNPKSLQASEKRFISLELLLCVACVCSIIRKQHVYEQRPPYFCFGIEACEIKQPAVRSDVKVGPFYCRVEGMMLQEPGKDPKRCWGNHAVLFNAAGYVKWLLYVSVILYCLLHADVERFFPPKLQNLIESFHIYIQYTLPQNTLGSSSPRSWSMPSTRQEMGSAFTPYRVAGCLISHASSSKQKYGRLWLDRYILYIAHTN